MYTVYVRSPGYQLVVRKRASASRGEALSANRGAQIAVWFNTWCYVAFVICVVCAGQVYSRDGCGIGPKVEGKWGLCG